jgi:outer membrane protein assembly factor BamE (lipoprotein component of BamABCDE complex)
MKRRKFLSGLAMLASVGLVAACSPIIDYRGYLPKGENIKKVKLGQTKGEVTSILGSPSTTATISTSNDSFYYISSVIHRVAFYAPEVVDREILAVHFSPEGEVIKFAHYGLEDGQIVDFISRKTPTRGKEMTVVQQLFANIGRFGDLPTTK